MRTESWEVCRKAVDKWGVDAQLDHMIEECAELIVAINHFRRNNKECRASDVESEIADVELMVEQMKLIFNPENIWKHKQEKIQRLNKLLEE